MSANCHSVINVETALWTLKIKYDSFAHLEWLLSLDQTDNLAGLLEKLSILKILTSPINFESRRKPIIAHFQPSFWSFWGHSSLDSTDSSDWCLKLDLWLVGNLACAKLSLQFMTYRESNKPIFTHYRSYSDVGDNAILGTIWWRQIQDVPNIPKVVTNTFHPQHTSRTSM